MAGRMPPQMPPLGTFYPNGHPPIMPPPPADIYQPRLQHLQTWSTESLGSYTDYDEPPRTMISPQSSGGSRSRKRHPPGSEHVKHRRTRSGCYTCRQRRVKCDETHPICDRCRKGKRECTYPGTSSSRSARNASVTSKESGTEEASSPSEEDIDVDDRTGLAPIPDDDEDDAAQEDREPNSAVSEPSMKLDTTLVPKEPSTQRTESPLSATATRPTRPSAARSHSRHAIRQPSISHSGRWASLPSQVKFYVRYNQNHMSHHHYAFKIDGGDFLKTTFLEIALNDSSGALLYAIVAFSAYHFALEQGNPRISEFLEYYNRSIVFLSQSLKSKKPSITTLLTILQLATIEEFLGDWVNLLGHQRAAYQILLDLFTPQTVMQDETRRKILAWYIRFDLFAGMMGGGETSLGREWFAAARDFYAQHARERPDDTVAHLERYFAEVRLLATDIALLFAGKAKGGGGADDDGGEFARRAEELLAQSARFGAELDAAWKEPGNFVRAFPATPPPSADDIADYRDPAFLLGGELFTMNFAKMDYWSIDQMLKYQLSVASRDPAMQAELARIGLRTCKMIEMIQHYEHAPPGVVLGCQASLGIASLFLPREPRFTNWARRKYALMEQKGYVYPSTLRTRMSATWDVDVTHWWLPHEEGYPAVVRAIREFIEYRARVPADDMSAHVRDMSGIFGALDLEGGGGDTPTEELAANPLAEARGRGMG